MLENILLIIAGFFLLIKGADILVDGASNIAKKFHISHLIIGLTVVAIGTSVPELMVCIKSAMIGKSDLSIGSSIGSNIFNLFFILGICSVISPIKFKKETKLIEIPLSLVIIFTIFIIANNGGVNKEITKIEGIILLVLFFQFVIYTIFMGKYGELFEKRVELIEDDEISIVKSLAFIIAGSIALKFGGDFVVENIVEILKSFDGIEQIVSLTVLSIGTSLPELITSITAVVKKEKDIAVGNVLGSNIINFLLIIGASSIFSPIKYSVEYNLDLLILFIGTSILLFVSYIGKKNYVSRINGMFLIFGYIGYMVTMFVR